tara:strand:- start:768 stop:995 length:228 start_codon:yes stop_codon:yes gene_type:complete
MTHFFIDSEHDMEVNITYLTELAKSADYSKVDITFPSQFMMHTFMDNLLNNFADENVPQETNMDISIFVPGGDDE